MLMMPDNLSQATPDAVSHDRSTDPFGSDKPDAKGSVAGEIKHAQHQNCAALHFALVLDAHEFR